jgi:hypothetical protein
MLDGKLINSKKLQSEFRKYAREIAKYLDKKNIRKYPIVEFQDANSSDELPRYGKGFGSTTIDNKIIIANWLMKLQKKEQPIILEQVLIREAFRLFLYSSIQDIDDFQELIEIVLNAITVVWILNNEQLRLVDSKSITVRGRLPFEDDDVFRSLNWEWVVIYSHKYGISVYKLFNKLVELVNKGVEEKLSMKTISDEYLYWVELLREEENYLTLPIYFKQKHFDMLKAMFELGVVKASAKNVGEIIGKSYNVVDISFKELFEEYFIYWRALPNIILLKLYPYFFRVTLKDNSFLNFVIRKLKTIKYLKDIDICNLGEEGFIVSGTLDCPLVVGENLANYFEQLLKKGSVKDYFLQMMKKRVAFCTITTEKLELNDEIFHQLITNPTQFNLQTLKIYEQNFDITDPPKPKRTVFDENVLSYLSLIAARYLGKAHYMFLDIDKGFKFCQKNNVDPADMGAVKNLISQLDFRARRLGAMDYYLNIQNIGNYNNSIYCELLIDPKSEIVNTFLEKIKVFSAMIITEFFDRVTIHFPKIKYDTPLTKILEEELSKSQIEHHIFPFVHYKSYIPSYLVQFDELYDFEEKKWKY